jgi:hypothetical protein
MTAAHAWSTLGLHWLEMMAASGQVIARRTRQRPTPARLFGMGAEKVEAAVESANAMARGMITFPTHDPLAMWNAWAGVLTSGMAPYRSRALRNSRRSRATRPKARPIGRRSR